MKKISYLIEKFKGIYRIKAPIDARTNDFPRKINGQYEDIDLYIDCQFGNKVFYQGNSTLLAYIPSVGRGRNIIQKIKETNPSIIYNIEETDEEILFEFKYDDSEQIIPLLKPRTIGKNISPFSVKNKKEVNYIMPEEDLKEYKFVISKMDNIICLSKINNMFFKKYLNKSELDLYKSIRMKPVYYIHSIGKFADYLNFIKEEIKNY